MKGKVQLHHGEDYYLKVLLKETKLHEIMTKKPITIYVDEPFSLVPKKLASNRIRHLPVIDRHDHLVGLITERELFKIQPPHKLEDGTWYYDDRMLDSYILQYVMIGEPFTMHINDSMGDLVKAMVTKKFGCVPIVDDEIYLKGIITLIDILKVALQIYQEGENPA